jgi:heme A synthase
MWLARLARLTAVATFMLLLAGASVTSTGSGLAVPDWPLSYGMLFPPMVGGVLFEHGHRMIAGVVGLLIAALALALWRSSRPAALKRLGWAAAGLVVVQAGLGGLTVLMRLPPAVSIAHALLAMVVFALVLAIAVRTTVIWDSSPGSLSAGPARALAHAALGAVGLQILLGALVRHTGAGLACPDFPLCHGRLWPEMTNPWVAIHFAHRWWALGVAGLVAALAWSARVESAPVRAGAWTAAALVVAQIALGGAAVLTGLAPAVTVAHHAGGALLLAAALWCTLWARRGSPAASRVIAPPLAGSEVPA